MARQYRKEYLKYQSSPRRRAYRAALNREARRRGHYGRTPAGKELVHKGGNIVGLGDKKANRRDGARKGTLARLRNRRRRVKRR